MAEMSEAYNYFDTTYRTNVSRWGGRAYKNQNDPSATIDIQAVSTKNANLRRCVDTLNTKCSPITIPNSTTRSTFVPHMPRSRDIGATFSKRVPKVPSPPQAPDEDVLRPSTEYRSRFTKLKPEPFVRPETMERCATTTIKSRSISTQNIQPPAWDTTYRVSHCSQLPKAQSSPAVTFHSHTHLR